AEGIPAQPPGRVGEGERQRHRVHHEALFTHAARRAGARRRRRRHRDGGVLGHLEAAALSAAVTGLKGDDMTRPGRREFIGLTGAGVAGAIAAPWLGGGTPAAAQTVDAHDVDLVVLNATVHTVDPGAPRAEAFAVKGGRIVAVGSSADIRGLVGKGTQTFDADRKSTRLNSSHRTISYAVFC